MRYSLSGYTSESHTREKEHNYWHDEIEGALSVYFPRRALALLHLWLDDNSGLHDDNVPIADAEKYL